MGSACAAMAPSRSTMGARLASCHAGAGRRRDHGGVLQVPGVAVIVLAWRLFCKWVIGTRWMKRRCRRGEYCPSGHEPSPVCINANCRGCCDGGYLRDHSSCKCEQRFSKDELDMVKRFRDSKYLEGVVIPCDWCDEPAITFISRGPRESRRFLCAAHRSDYDRDLSDWWAKSTWPGRDRFARLEFEEVSARLRRWNEKRR